MSKFGLQKMKPYPIYKPTNIDWIGEIPEHWSQRKVAWSFDLIGSGTTPKSDSDLYYENGTNNWLLTGDLNDGEIFETTKKITDYAIIETSSLKKYPVNSVVIAMYGATIGKLGILKIETTTNQACCVLAKSFYFDHKYVFYWLLSSRESIINLSYGGGQPNINQEIVKGLRLTFPPLPEQQAIVAFLDQKTALIDELIAKKERKIELLKEKRTALINHVVTKGLDPTVKYKDSGIDWIGEIPEHWEVSKVKWELIFHNNLRVPIEADKRGERQGEYPYYGASGIIDFVDDFIFDGEYILVGEDGANILSRSTPLAFLASGKFWVNNHAHILQVRKGQNKYFSMQIELNDFTTKASGSAQPKLTKEAIGELELVVPNISEQQRIVEYLENQTALIDQNISLELQKIEKLKEYRQSLISNVVTGKIRVI
ncbi:MAG: restriction endonuclease subunit S [Spirosomataceae bacterium]|jgi:restriction endonuclease S subunit